MTTAAPAYLFDAVGTLIYPEPAPADVYYAAGVRCGSRLAREEIEHGFRTAFAAEEARDARHNGLRTDEARELERWRQIVAAVVHDVVGAAAERLFEELWNHFARPSAWRAFDDAAPTLAALAARGHTVAIASNFDRRLYAIVAELLPAVPPERVFVSSTLGFRKPAAAFFQGCRERIGLTNYPTIVVGDDVANDLQCPRTEGLTAILLDRRDRHPELAPRIATLAELL